MEGRERERERETGREGGIETERHRVEIDTAICKSIVNRGSSITNKQTNKQTKTAVQVWMKETSNVVKHLVHRLYIVVAIHCLQCKFQKSIRMNTSMVLPLVSYVFPPNILEAAWLDLLFTCTVTTSRVESFPKGKMLALGSMS